MMSPTYGRRSLEEELREPTLTCIPGAVATSLEKQVAMAIGLRGDNTMVPRLPRSASVEVSSCVLKAFLRCSELPAWKRLLLALADTGGLGTHLRLLSEQYPAGHRGRHNQTGRLRRIRRRFCLQELLQLRENRNALEAQRQRAKARHRCLYLYI